MYLKVFAYVLPLELLASGSIRGFPITTWNRNFENEKLVSHLDISSIMCFNKVFSHPEILNKSSSTGKSLHEKLKNLL